ncbi:MAG: hypothetical protein A2144_02930 [Chloroflexi bacterium RBG_16_50_9]|nr:MAG: hypothetical protein A2144_02930 [Chloroflexi bacterium RBG_16_50_9]
MYVGMGLVVALMILTVVNSVGRYGFDQPVLGVIELSDFFLLGSAFLVGAYTMVVKSHVAIGILVDRFPPRAQAVIDSLTLTFCLVAVIAAVWQSFARGIFMMHQGQATAILHIPRFPFYYVVAFGWALLAVAIIMRIAHLFPKAVKG